MYVTEEQRCPPGCLGREIDRLSHSRALSGQGTHGPSRSSLYGFLGLAFISAVAAEAWYLSPGNDDVTLVISVHRRAPSSGELGPNLVTQPGAELAGWEVWRKTVYGSAAVRQRGGHFLPQLAGADLVLEGDDLLAFKKECAVLLSDVFSLASEVGVDAEHLRFRLSNMAAATEQAISIGGVVWIS